MLAFEPKGIAALQREIFGVVYLLMIINWSKSIIFHSCKSQSC